VEKVTLWHGTTQSAAQAIAAGGFRRTGTAHVVEATAVECGTDPAAALSALRAAHRFAVVQERRDDAVWFATSRERAGRWSQRSPEGRWEALWGAWWAAHGSYEAMPAPWADPAAAAWHARHFWGDAPAVVQVSIPASRLQDRYKDPLPDEQAAEFAGVAAEVSVAYLVPAEWVAGYEVTPRRIDFAVAAGLLGVTTDELGRRVDAGEIAGCQPPEWPGLGSWYWELTDLLPRVNRQPAAADIGLPGCRATIRSPGFRGKAAG
jgi:hypothetical protein